MTTYPGDDPQQPDDPQNPASGPPENDAPTPGGTEPTQPVGYWERRASEQAAEQARAQGSQPYPTTPYPQGGPVFNPTSQNPYSQPPQDQGQRPAATPRTPTPRTPTHSPAPRRTAGSHPAPHRHPASRLRMPHAAVRRFRGRPPDHPQATLALVLGLVGVVGAFIFCGVPLLVSPFAWAVGHLRSRRSRRPTVGSAARATPGPA